MRELYIGSIGSGSQALYHIINRIRAIIRPYYHQVAELVLMNCYKYVALIICSVNIINDNYQ